MNALVKVFGDMGTSGKGPVAKPGRGAAMVPARPRKMGGHGYHRQRKTVVVEEEVVAAPAPSGLPIDVVFVVDTSGSMSGSRAKIAADAVEQMVRDLSHRDSVSVCTFDTEVTWQLKAMPAKSYRHDTMMRKAGDGRGGFRCGSVTALFDAVKEAFGYVHRGRRKREGVFPMPYVVVVSDGCDNASSTSPAEVQRLVRKPKDAGLGGRSMANLQVRFLTIGDEAKAVATRTFMHRGQGNLRHFPADGDLESIRRQFHAVREDLQVIVRHRRTVTIEEVHSGAAHPTSHRHKGGAGKSIVRSCRGRKH